MKRLSSRRAKACAISPAVRAFVFDREKFQCFRESCRSSYILTPAHVVSRAKNGLGIKENVVAACLVCHDILDHGTKEERESLYNEARDYLRGHYPNLDEICVEYKKYDF